MSRSRSAGHSGRNAWCCRDNNFWPWEPIMQRVALNSRLISAVAFDADTEVLHVWLANRRHIRHANVTAAIYENLINADSAGFYYTCYIARSEDIADRRRPRFLVRLVVACILSTLLVSLSATAIGVAG